MGNGEWGMGNGEWRRVIASTRSNPEPFLKPKTSHLKPIPVGYPIRLGAAYRSTILTITRRATTTPNVFQYFLNFLSNIITGGV